MRIIQFSDSFLPIMDGVGNVVCQYARNLAEKGHETYVVAPQTDTGYRGGYPFEMVDYIGLPLPLMKNYRVGLPALDPHCRNRLNAIHAEIAHVHTPFVAGQGGITYAQKLGIPIVGSFHTKYYDDFLQLTGMELLAEAGVRYVVNFYEKCDEVWAVSASSADTLRGYGYEGPLEVVPNGTDVHPVTDAQVREACERFRIREDVPLLMYAGQINWKKNLRCILEACASLDRPFQLVLAGQGPHAREVQELTESLGIAANVRFTGHLGEPESLNALYKRADLFLFPSLYDTSGLVVQEAAAMGTPSVVVKGSSAAECIRDESNGYLCSDEPADLCRVIRRALDDPEALRQIGLNASRTIPLPWSDLVDGVIERYAALLKRHSSIA
ncbi:MAG: glycosyltransferase [Clostridia bacterium]|nr:glycosyltransferase [Clostridia bacterium]